MSKNIMNTYILKVAILGEGLTARARGPGPRPGPTATARGPGPGPGPAATARGPGPFPMGPMGPMGSLRISLGNSLRISLGISLGNSLGFSLGSSLGISPKGVYWWAFATVGAMAGLGFLYRFPTFSSLAGWNLLQNSTQPGWNLAAI